MDTERSRRGNFFMLFALAIVVVFGFGALAADVSFMRMSQSQVQDVADAAGQGAAVVMKRYADPVRAQTVAQKIVAMNTVAGESPKLESIEFGLWTQGSDQAGVFDTLALNPNAVRVQVTRRDTRSIPFLLASIFGYQKFGVSATSTSASRNVHVVISMDITNSWNPNNFVFARDAAVSFLDTMRGSAGPYDKLGMNVFTGRYAWATTPLVTLRDTTAISAARTQWVLLKTASKAGNGSNWPSTCALNSDPNRNNFGWPVAGGCYPNMPREYTDEPGTDHSTGLEMSARMFDSDPDPSAERVLLMLTDGIPNGIATGHGAIRAGQGYVESRWAEYKGPAPHSTSAIQADSVALAEEMWLDQRVHIYVVSFVQDATFLHDMPQGQGYFTLTNSASALTPIFQQIANSLPVAVVE